MHKFNNISDLSRYLYSIDKTDTFDYDGNVKSGEDPQTRISSSVMINDRWFHYEAIEVKADDCRTAVNPSLQPKLDALIILAGANFDDLRTITVAGRNYVEYLFPFCL